MLTNRRQFAFLLILPLLLLIFWTAQASGVVTSWGPNVRANADTGTASQHEPHLAISRTDPDVVVVAAKDYRTANTKEVWIYVSQDGGQTWPAGQQLRIPGLPGDISEQSDPVVVARDDGRIYVAALGYGSGHGLFLTWSDDDGDTWANSRSITHNETPGGLDDKEWLAVDNFPASAYYHNLYVAWANDGLHRWRRKLAGLHHPGARLCRISLRGGHRRWRRVRLLHGWLGLLPERHHPLCALQ